MTRLFVAGIVLAMLFSTVAAADTNPHARDTVLLAQWFEGQFDNEEQLWFQADPRSNTPSEGRHGRIHTTHLRLNLPEFGDHVFYVEEYKDNNPADVFRQRLVRFSSGSDMPSIRMQQGFFKDAARFVGQSANAAAFADLTADDVFFMDQCDVYWNRIADQFEGKMKPKACVFGEGDKRRYSVHNLTLSQDKYWRADVTFLVSDDSLHVGHPIDQPHQMRRAREFICDVSFREEDGDSQQIKGLRVHSQGGTAHFTRAADGQEYTILVRDKQYPFYETRPDFLFLSLRLKGERRSVVYSVSDSNSRRMGVNNGRIGAHCHMDGYTFGETYEQLQ